MQETELKENRLKLAKQVSYWHELESSMLSAVHYLRNATNEWLYRRKHTKDTCKADIEEMIKTVKDLKAYSDVHIDRIISLVAEYEPERIRKVSKGTLEEEIKLTCNSVPETIVELINWIWTCDNLNWEYVSYGVTKRTRWLLVPIKNGPLSRRYIRIIADDISTLTCINIEDSTEHNIENVITPNKDVYTAISQLLAFICIELNECHATCGDVIQRIKQFGEDTSIEMVNNLSSTNIHCGLLSSNMKEQISAIINADINS